MLIVAVPDASVPVPADLFVPVVTLIFVVVDKESYSVDEDTAYVVQLEFLDGQGFSEVIFLNDRKHITKVKIQQNKSFIIEETSREVLLQEFPERADFIL